MPWLECHPVHQKVVGSVPRQGPYPRFKCDPLSVLVGGNWSLLPSHIHVSFPPLLPLSPSLLSSLFLSSKTNLKSFIIRKKLSPKAYAWPISTCQPPFLSSNLLHKTNVFYNLVIYVTNVFCHSGNSLSSACFLYVCDCFFMRKRGTFVSWVKKQCRHVY